MHIFTKQWLRWCKEGLLLGCRDVLIQLTYKTDAKKQVPMYYMIHCEEFSD